MRGNNGTPRVQKLNEGTSSGLQPGQLLLPSPVVDLVEINLSIPSKDIRMSLGLVLVVFDLPDMVSRPGR